MLPPHLGRRHTMPDDLIFYTNPMSRGRIVRWMLEEVGEPYQTEIIFYGDAMKSAGYRAINPMAKVPALRHGTTTVTETAAICAYLADTFPDAGLAPPSGQRGAYYRWLFFAAGPLEAAIANKRLGVEVNEEQSRMIGYGSFDQVIDTLEATLDGIEYVAAGQFTAADIYVGSEINFGTMFGMIESRPVFEAYLDRLKARPAFQRATEIDDALMPEQS
jgi:glutathione S-transferase